MERKRYLLQPSLRRGHIANRLALLLFFALIMVISACLVYGLRNLPC
jgi:hypothetical protein